MKYKSQRMYFLFSLDLCVVIVLFKNFVLVSGEGGLVSCLFFKENYGTSLYYSYLLFYTLSNFAAFLCWKTVKIICLGVGV